MKKIVLLAAIGIGLSIVACSKLKESPDPIQDPIGVTEDVQPVSQKTIAAYFSANPGSSETLKGDVSTFLSMPTKSGATIMIYPNSLVDMDGNDVSGEVQFNLQEFYSPEDMIRGNVNTVTDQEELLVSGGMFKLEASQGGKTLRMKDGYNYGVRFPDSDPSMEAYMGVKSSDGSVVWKRRNDWDTRIDTTNFQNAIYLDSFTYCNLDRLAQMPNSTNLTIRTDERQKEMPFQVKMIFRSSRIVTYMPYNSPGLYQTHSRYMVPKGETIHVIVYHLDGEGYLYWHDFEHTIDENGSIQLPLIPTVSEAVWKARLAAIK